MSLVGDQEVLQLRGRGSEWGTQGGERGRGCGQGGTGGCGQQISFARGNEDSWF